MILLHFYVCCMYVFLNLWHDFDHLYNAFNAEINYYIFPLKNMWFTLYHSSQQHILEKNVLLFWVLLVFLRKELYFRWVFKSVLLSISHVRKLCQMTANLLSLMVCSLLCLLSSEDTNYSCFLSPQTESIIIFLLHNASFS